MTMVWVQGQQHTVQGMCINWTARSRRSPGLTKVWPKIKYAIMFPCACIVIVYYYWPFNRLSKVICLCTSAIGLNWPPALVVLYDHDPSEAVAQTASMKSSVVSRHSRTMFAQQVSQLITQAHCLVLRWSRVLWILFQWADICTMSVEVCMYSAPKQESKFFSFGNF